MKSPAAFNLEALTPMPRERPMFANILEQRSFGDDIVGASLLVLGAIPAAFFLVLAVLTPPPAACVDASTSVDAPIHVQS